MSDPKYPLILSSGLFLLPVIFGFYKNKRFLPAVSFICMLVSMNYWKHPETNTPQHQTDLIISKITGILFFLQGYRNVRGFYRFIGFINAFIIISCYLESCKLYIRNDEQWIRWHMAFHLFTAINKMIVLQNG
jgi:hypothetical protein